MTTYAQGIRQKGVAFLYAFLTVRTVQDPLADMVNIRLSKRCATERHLLTHYACGIFELLNQVAVICVAYHNQCSARLILARHSH